MAAAQQAPIRAHFVIPGAFTHPLFWAALVLLLANDHWLKGAGLLPGWLTGKLSDFAGMLVAPPLFALLLGARRASARIAATLFTGGLMSAIKLSPAGAQLVEGLFGLWGLQSVIASDPTDLVALAILPVGHALCAPASPGMAASNRALPSVGIALAAFACMATTGSDEGDSNSRGDAPSVQNASDEPIVVVIASTEGAGGCRLYRDDRIAALTSDAFSASREVTLDPGERIALPEDGGDTGCGAASLQLPDGDGILVFWRDLDEIESFVPSDDDQRLDRMVILDGEPGSFDLEVGDDLTIFQLGGQAPEPNCPIAELEHSLVFSPLSGAQGFLEPSEMRTTTDGCLEVDWLAPGGDTSVETQTLCIPDWGFPFEPGEILSVVQDAPGAGERSLRVTRYDGARVELQLVLWNDASTFLESRVDELEAADCFGEISACGAYLRPVEVKIKGRDEPLVAGEEVSVRGGEPDETRVLVGATRDVAWSSPTCEGAEARVGPVANVLELRMY